jgi:hypothetical protein
MSRTKLAVKWKDCYDETKQGCRKPEALLVSLFARFCFPKVVTVFFHRARQPVKQPVASARIQMILKKDTHY